MAVQESVVPGPHAQHGNSAPTAAQHAAPRHRGTACGHQARAGAGPMQQHARDTMRRRERCAPLRRRLAQAQRHSGGAPTRILIQHAAPAAQFGLQACSCVRGAMAAALTAAAGARPAVLAPSPRRQAATVVCSAQAPAIGQQDRTRVGKSGEPPRGRWAAPARPVRLVGSRGADQAAMRPTALAPRAAPPPAPTSHAAAAAPRLPSSPAACPPSPCRPHRVQRGRGCLELGRPLQVLAVGAGQAQQPDGGWVVVACHPPLQRMWRRRPALRCSGRSGLAASCTQHLMDRECELRADLCAPRCSWVVPA